MTRTLTRTILAAALASAAPLLGGCGDDDACGPADAPAAGVELSTEAAPLVFGGFTSSPNNDCPPSPDATATSLTIEGFQQGGGAGDGLLFCVPRPDEAEAGAPVELTLDAADTTRVQVVDAFATDGDCTLRLDRARAVAGTVTFSGMCEAGTDAAGYALELDAQLPMLRTCGDQDPAPVSAELTGRVAVVAE